MNAVAEIGTTPILVQQNGYTFNARRVSVDEYEAMIRHGILTGDDKVELLNGVIVEKMTKGPRHTVANYQFSNILTKKLDGQAVIRIQDPIRLGNDSEPEPDIVAAKPPIKRYSEQHPTSDDIFFVVEIADTSLENDRFVKGMIYAEEEIQQYIIVNLIDETIEDYRLPTSDGYDSKQTCLRGESFSLVAFPDIEIDVNDLF